MIVKDQAECFGCDWAIKPVGCDTYLVNGRIVRAIGEIM